MRSHVLLTLTIAASLTAVRRGAATVRDSAAGESSLGAAGPGRSGTGCAWNQIVNEIAFAEDQFLTFKGDRAYAMTHIAIHDALNAVVPLYRQFAYLGREPGAIQSPLPRRRRTTWSCPSIRVSTRNWTRSLWLGFHGSRMDPPKAAESHSAAAYPEAPV